MTVCLDSGGGNSGRSSTNFPSGGSQKPPSNSNTAGWIAAITAFAAGIFGTSKTDNDSSPSEQNAQVQDNATGAAAGGATPPGNDPDKDKEMRDAAADAVCDVAGAVACPTDLALGFTKNLPKFTKGIPNAQNYEDLGLSLNEHGVEGFTKEIRSYMDSADRIHFDLTDMTYLNDPDVGVLKGPANLNWS